MESMHALSRNWTGRMAPSLSSSSHSPQPARSTRQRMGPPESSPKTGLSSVRQEGAFHWEGGE